MNSTIDRQIIKYQRELIDQLIEENAAMREAMPDMGVVQAMAKLISYLQDEERDYEADQIDGRNTSGHIWESVETVTSWQHKAAQFVRGQE